MSWFAHKLQSGALQFTVFVAVLIALLLAGMMLYAYTFVYMKEQSKGAIENIRYSGLGMDFLLHQSQTGTDTITVNFIKKENQTLKVHLSQWGVFEKAVAISQFRKKKFVKTAIIGSQINAQESPTLFLQETQNPLTIVGNTAIKGIVYLPSQGVKSGYIAGNSYYGSQLIYGTIKNSTLFLPKLNPTTLNCLTFYLEEYAQQNRQDYINLETTQRIINSFKKKTKGGYSKKKIILENRAISGNIIIKSETLILVKNTTLLKDIILIAPIIEIEEGTKGNFQCIASRKITVHKNCTLEYPSALILFQDNKTNQETLSTLPFDNQIFIDSGSVIKGSVCYFQTNKLPTFLTQIILQSEAKVKGQVYCNGNFELLGTVSGCVFTKQFLANQSGSIFVNHIYNGIIENENMPTIFGGIILEKEPKTVLKWLY